MLLSLSVAVVLENVFSSFHHERVKKFRSTSNENVIPSTTSTTALHDAAAKSIRFMWSPSAVQTSSSFTNMSTRANSLIGMKK